jgi:hypothetical protein
MLHVTRFGRAVFVEAGSTRSAFERNVATIALGISVVNRSRNLIALGDCPKQYAKAFRV